MTNGASFLVALLVLVSSLDFSTALSSGAAQCVEGAVSVGSPHMVDGAITGSLADGGLELAIDGAVLDPATPLTAGMDIPIAVRSTDGASTFRGALIRLNSLSDDSAFDVDDSGDVQLSSFCVSPAAGVTHTSNSDKTQLGGTLMLSETATGPILVDVTVVVSSNSNDGSVYYYSAYTLDVAAAAAVPTDPGAATLPPTAAPAAGEGASNTTAPVAAPTDEKEDDDDLEPEAPSADAPAAPVGVAPSAPKAAPKAPAAAPKAAAPSSNAAGSAAAHMVLAAAFSMWVVGFLY